MGSPDELTYHQLIRMRYPARKSFAARNGKINRKTRFASQQRTADPSPARHPGRKMRAPPSPSKGAGAGFGMTPQSNNEKINRREHRENPEFTEKANANDGPKPSGAKAHSARAE